MHWVPRVAVLSALGLTTILAPISGVARADAEVLVALGSGATSSTDEVVSVELTDSALDRLDAAGRVAVEAWSATELVGVQTAPNRALVSSSRTLERSIAACSPELAGSANGVRAALTAATVVQPLVEGSYRLSSDYGYRYHPITGQWSLHSGMDFAAPIGTPIHAVADGVVRHSGNGIDGRSNQLVIIEHEIEGQTFYSWYVHMYPQGVFVEEGDVVSAGEVIAEVGNNGNSTGPHLHLEIHVDDVGTTVDPAVFLEEYDAVQVAGQACVGG